MKRIQERGTIDLFMGRVQNWGAIGLFHEEATEQRNN